MSDYDEELRWRLEVLRAEFDAGRIRIAEHLAEDTERSLNAVRYGPDGKIDLSTVDGRVRSMALAAAFFHNRNSEKEAISLSDIASTYFEFVEKNLGFLADKAKDKGYNAAHFAHAVSENQSAVDDLAPQTAKFLEALQEFWESVADASHYHIQDLDACKAIFGGDLFPVIKETSRAQLVSILTQSCLAIRFFSQGISLNEPRRSNRSTIW